MTLIFYFIFSSYSNRFIGYYIGASTRIGLDCHKRQRLFSWVCTAIIGPPPWEIRLAVDNSD
jgi:hypothetical protein